MFFIYRHEVPNDTKVPYFCSVCDIFPQKKETQRLQITVGGEKLTFDRPVSTPKSDITTSKLHWNSVILTTGFKYLMVDFNKFYLNNIMVKHEIYNIAIVLIPQEGIDEYNLIDKQINRFLYVRVEKGMYGLFLGEIISKTALKEHIRPFGYEPAPITPGI